MNQELNKLIAKFGSQRALADAYGVSETAVSKWIKAKALPLDRAKYAAENWGFDAAKLVGLA